MAKRKAASALDNGKPKRRHTASLADKFAHTSKQTFCFLELPAELRTPILKYAARAHGTGLINRCSRGELSSIDAMSMASKQLRTEYLALLYSHAGTILAHVLDFDFRHVVTFFNKLHASDVGELLEESDLAVYDDEEPSGEEGDLPGQDSTAPAHGDNKTESFSPIQETAPRRFKAILDFTRNCPADPPYLTRWLGRQYREDKTGSYVLWEYEAVSSTAVKQWRRREVWSNTMQHRLWLPGPRDEVSEIRQALKRVAGEEDYGDDRWYVKSDEDWVSSDADSSYEDDEYESDKGRRANLVKELM